ncbi:MAG: hypothetical protein IPJ81_03785 [Chitinophagaceae bacterium]|nr:hypothetical protein [Chitinophagaceae bacterium]
MIRKLLCLFCICINLELSAQTEDNKTTIFPAPDVASIVKGYQISNDYFNGSININLPLYELNSKNVIIPISVSYNGGGIKPDEQPGILGIGWKLNVGGVISRNVKNQPDEYRPLQSSKDIIPGMIIYNTDVAPGNYGYIDNYSKLDKNDWSSQTYLNTFNTNSPYAVSTPNSLITNANPLYDLEPDEFIFVFNGISGKFSLDYTGKWKVITDAPGITFIVEPVIGNEVKKASGKNIPRAYIQFKLTANDGTVYFFGDANNTYPANIDYSHKSKWEKDPANSYGGPIIPTMPSAWHLSKIVTNTGQEINFSYQKIGFAAQKVLSYWGYYPPGSPIAQIPSPKSMDKVLTETWYLESITTNDNVKVKFNLGPSTQLGTDEIIESGSNYFLI